MTKFSLGTFMCQMSKNPNLHAQKALTKIIWSCKRDLTYLSQMKDMCRCMLTQIVVSFFNLFSRKIQNLYEHPLSLADQYNKAINIIS